MKTNNFFVIITIVMMLLFVGCQYSVNTTINYPTANEAGATGDDNGNAATGEEDGGNTNPTTTPVITPTTTDSPSDRGDDEGESSSSSTSTTTTEETGSPGTQQSSDPSSSTGNETGSQSQPVVVDSSATDVANAKTALQIGFSSNESAINVKNNITLATENNGVAITWSSSNTALISNAGIVTRPDYADANVTLTATLSKGTVSDTREFTVTVTRMYDRTFRSLSDLRGLASLTPISTWLNDDYTLKDGLDLPTEDEVKNYINNLPRSNLSTDSGVLYYTTDSTTSAAENGVLVKTSSGGFANLTAIFDSNTYTYLYSTEIVTSYFNLQEYCTYDQYNNKWLINTPLVQLVPVSS